MKFLAAFLLVVATVHANSLHYYGWVPGKETLFQYESEALMGIPEIKASHLSGVRVSSKVRVQSYSDYSLRIKIEEPKFFSVNGEVTSTETGRLTKEQSPEVVKPEVIPGEFLHFLEEPFLVYMKSGIVQTFLVPKNEPVSVTNIKKAVLAQIQLDIAGTRRSQIEANHIQLPLNEEGQISEHISFFTTTEERVDGECMTEYTIHKLPQWKINEMEQQWSKEEMKIKGLETSTNMVEPLKGTELCQGKPYYLITRNVNYDQCKHRPVFQQWINLPTQCDVSKAECESTMTHSSNTQTYICGELNAFVVRKSINLNVRHISPLGFKTGEEQVAVNSIISLELLAIKPISQRLTVASSTRIVKSLVYSYPEEIQESELNPEVVSETETILGIRPILPQPGLTEAPNLLIPLSLPREQIIPQVFEQLQKMAREVFESDASKSDLTGTLSTITMYMRALSLPQLEKLEKMVKEQSLSGHKSIEKIFYDTLALVGTNPSTMLVISKVKSGSLPSSILPTIVAKTLRSVRYPTKELLAELVKTVKSLSFESNKQLFTTTILNLSELIYRAYVNPTTMTINFPTKIYGVFGTKDSSVVVDEYIPFLVEKLASNPHPLLHMSVISSLGKLGHLKALKPLLLVTSTPRSVAIYSIKRIAKLNPSEVRPILMTIITNPVESEDVRIAAVSVLPFANPTIAELQTLAIRSWFEPSKQVSTFIYSTLKSLATTQVPVLKAIGLKAQAVLPMIKPEVIGIHRSHNINLSTLVEYLDSVVSTQFLLTNSKESLIPHHLLFKSKVFAPAMSEFGSVSFAAYTYGMDTLIEKYLPYIGYATELSPAVQRQLQQITQELRLKISELPTPEAFIQQSVNGLESAMFIDSEFVLETVEELSRKWESQQSFEFSHVSASQFAETTDFGFTSTGLPLMGVTSGPSLVAVKGSIKTESIQGALLPKITAKVIPMVNVKLQSVYGVMLPFTQELIGGAVDMSLHSSIPVEVEGTVTQGKLEVTLRTPDEIKRSGAETVILHGLVMPYTVKMSLLSVKPPSQSLSLKKIVSPSVRSPLEIPVGKSLGLSARLVYASDAKFNDVSSYIQKISQHTPTSFIHAGLLPSSIRFSSTKLVYLPAQSEIKEINLILKLSTKGLPHTISSGPINDSEMDIFPAIKETLSKLNGPESSAAVLEIIASSKTQLGLKTIKSAILIGKKSGKEMEKQLVQTFAAVGLKPINGPSYDVHYEGSIVLPTLVNKWNIENLIQESLKMMYDGTLVLGKEIIGEEVKVSLKTKLTKTENLIKSILASPEYKKCMADIRIGQKLSPSCISVRQEAAALDKIELTLSVPKIISRSNIVYILTDILKSLSIGQVEYTPSEMSSTGQLDIIKIETIADRVSEVAQVNIISPTTTMKIENLRLLGLTKSIFPLSLYSPVSSLLPQKLTGLELPATCRIEPRIVTTFDGKTIGYKVNDCEHVLLVDSTKTLPVAVVTRTIPQQKKLVKILSGVVEVILTPVSSGMDVKVNGVHVPITQGSTYTKEISAGVINVLIKRHADNVYVVSVPSQSLTVVTDGESIEVIAPQVLKSRAAGLCGDMNGEISADLKTPGMCIMKPQLAALTYILNKSGSSPSFPSCSGIPSELRAEFEVESKTCIKEEIIPTPVNELLERISSLDKPTITAHVVEKKLSQVCISRQMIKVCPSQSSPLVSGASMTSGRLMSKPLSIKPKLVEFVCVARPSTLAQSLVNRALAGESLYLAVSQLPTVYSKVEYEPLVCSESMARE